MAIESAGTPQLVSHEQRLVSRRFGTHRAIAPARGPRLRLTRAKRLLMREGMSELDRSFVDIQTWNRALAQAEQAQVDLGIHDLLPGYVMWTTNMAAIVRGAWWLLLPGCGAPALQATICNTLVRPWLQRRPEYALVADAIEQGKYPDMKLVLEWTERVRCLLTINVRE
jgi:hypothetical protein